MSNWILVNDHQRKENKMDQNVKEPVIHSYSLLKDYVESDPVLQTNITCPNLESACKILQEIEQIVTGKKQLPTSRCC